MSSENIKKEMEQEQAPQETKRGGSRPSSRSVEAQTTAPTVVSGDQGGKSTSNVDQSSIAVTIAPPSMPPRLPTSGSKRKDDPSQGPNVTNLVWCFGLSKAVSVLNLTSSKGNSIFYAAGHMGVIYDYENNFEKPLQGHANNITGASCSENKRWLVTVDMGPDSTVIIWDTMNGLPVQTIFADQSTNGYSAVAMSSDAKYIVTIGANHPQLVEVWDWTRDHDSPIASARLPDGTGHQSYVHFHPIHDSLMISNDDSHAVFYEWDRSGSMKFFTPQVNDETFNKHVGKMTQSVYLLDARRALTATLGGNMVIWQTLRRKDIESDCPAEKEAYKLLKIQERGISVLTTVHEYIVIGDAHGEMKFYNQSLQLVNWIQENRLGPIHSISFQYLSEFEADEPHPPPYDSQATLPASQFRCPDFVLATSTSLVAHMTEDGSEYRILRREHSSAVSAIAVHPSRPYLCSGSSNGLIQVWDYDSKKVVCQDTVDRSPTITCLTFDPSGDYLAVGTKQSHLYLLDSLTLKQEGDLLSFAKAPITHVAFSAESRFLATAEEDFAVTVYVRGLGKDKSLYGVLGRQRHHYKPIRSLIFGRFLDSSVPRLMSLGEDRYLVEYDLEASEHDDLKIRSCDRLEQSAVPTAMTWFPLISKEEFIVTANDQFKLKLFNSTTKMCRKTVLGPMFGAPLNKIAILPAAATAGGNQDGEQQRYIIFSSVDKLGIVRLPLTGSPFDSMAIIGHTRIADFVCSPDGQHVFTCGGKDASVSMWRVNASVLEAQHQLGGKGLEPFYCLLEGGQDGEFFREFKDLFYYCQIRHQGLESMEQRVVGDHMPLSEIAYQMRAVGFYPSEQQVDEMTNEVKLGEYVETGKFVSAVDLNTAVKLYINHRPAFGLDPREICRALATLGIEGEEEDEGLSRDELFYQLQSRGEHMTEIELAEYLAFLVNPEETDKSSEQIQSDLQTLLPSSITPQSFIEGMLGLTLPDGGSSAMMAMFDSPPGTAISNTA